MVPGAVGWNCPMQRVNGNVESFSLLTKYLSYYLSTPIVHGDLTGCWVAQAVRVKINSLSALASRCSGPNLPPATNNGWDLNCFCFPFRKTISQKSRVTALSLYLTPLNPHNHPARRLYHHPTLYLWWSHFKVRKTKAQRGYQGRAMAGNQVS